MKIKRGTYSAKEKAVIAEAITAYPGNMGLAFEQAAAELPGRTKGGVANQWYTKMQHDKNLPVLAVATRTGSMINRKVMKRPTTSRVGVGALQIAMIAVQELDPNETVALLRFMMQRDK